LPLLRPQARMTASTQPFKYYRRQVLARLLPDWSIAPLSTRSYYDPE
jgi:hypothetical protein